MARFRSSIRGQMVAVAIVGFDLAVMARAVQQGRASAAGHAGFEVVYVFGLLLLFLNIVGFSLYRYFANRADLPRATRLNSTPPPLVIFGLYASVLTVVILSVLLFTSGRF